MKITTTPNTANPKAHSNKMETQTQMNTAEADGVNMPVITSITSQLQNLEWWYNAWSKIGVGMGVLAAVLALLAAGAGAIAYWYSLQMKPLQDAAAQVKEDQLTLDLKGKEEKIAAANEATAKVDAESREKAAELAKEAEALRADAEKARANIATAQADAAQAGERTQQLAIEAAEARRRQAEAERALLELQERVKPRHLNDKQRARFIEVLRTAPKAPVEISCGDAEACGFAKQLSAALREAGWEVGGGDGDIQSLMQPFFGLQLVQRNQGAAMPSTQALYNALTEAGFAVDPRFDTEQTLPPNSLRLAIGIKP